MPYNKAENGSVSAKNLFILKNFKVGEKTVVIIMNEQMLIINKWIKILSTVKNIGANKIKEIGNI